MNEEFAWLGEKALEDLFQKYSEDQLRAVIQWLDNDPPMHIRIKVKTVLDRELNRRATIAYEQQAGGEWI